jgi:hypothetical protein
VALVIGNSDYRIGRLANPVNDATAAAETFEKRLKFDKVMLRMTEVAGRNFPVPVDATLAWACAQVAPSGPPPRGFERD